MKRALAPTALICVSEHSEASRPTFFHSAATCLHVPARLARDPTKHEGRKPRASERHVVGCCEELAGGARVRRRAICLGNVARMEFECQFANRLPGGPILAS